MGTAGGQGDTAIGDVGGRRTRGRVYREYGGQEDRDTAIGDIGGQGYGSGDMGQENRDTTIGDMGGRDIGVGYGAGGYGDETIGDVGTPGGQGHGYRGCGGAGIWEWGYGAGGYGDVTLGDVGGRRTGTRL